MTLIPEAHAGLGILVFVLIIIRAGWATAGYFADELLAYDSLLNRITTGLADLQVLLGIVNLMSLSMGNFIHPILAVIGVAALHIGGSKLKKEPDATGVLLVWLPVILLADRVVRFF